MKSRKTIEQDLQEILVAYKIGRITLEAAVRVIMFEINKVREETIREVEERERIEREKRQVEILKYLPKRKKK